MLLSELKRLIPEGSNAPCYEPPYDSPIEDFFAWNMAKYLDEKTTWERQVSVSTICGCFRMDFVANTHSRRIAFECDGEEFHGRHGCARDEWRDAMILGGEFVDAIYRIPGRLIVHDMHRSIAWLAECEPEVFSERSRINLRILARSARSAMRGGAGMVSDFYSPHPSIQIECFHRQPIVREWWQCLFAYAKEHGGGDLDSIINRWWNEHAPAAHSA